VPPVFARKSAATAKASELVASRVLAKVVSAYGMGCWTGRHMVASGGLVARPAENVIHLRASCYGGNV